MWFKAALQSLAALSIFIHSAQSTCSGVVPQASSSDKFWMENGGLHTRGASAYNPGYKVFRNVKSYGAVGNGVADDTDAINKAISDGGRCGQGCKSSTISPAIIYFPAGTYRVTKPIVPFYFTSLVGDYKNKPVLKAASNFVGVAVIDADPYVPGQSNPDGSGINWWQNQNNFFRSVRNFVIDVTSMPSSTKATGIHWQVGQATSLINLDFKMIRATEDSSTQHQGLFSENGSGGFMSDLTFDGGLYGMWISNQQFTIRNVKITNAGTAIFEAWNWGFTWHNIDIENCLVGFDILTGGLTLATQSTGGVLIVDSWIKNVVIGIRTSSSQPSKLGGSVVLDQVQFSNIISANIQDNSGVVMAANANYGDQYFQGNVYSGVTKSYKRGTFHPSTHRPASLVNAFGAYFSRSRPQYQDYKDVQFQSVKDIGKAAGDGVKDDTAAINSFLQNYGGCYILLFEAGTYLVTDTIVVPPNTIIVGEMFSTILGSGSKFADQKNPRPVLKVGNPGDTGVVEISDMVIATTGGSAGAIGIQWNIKASKQGSAGMWDVHVRLGGAKGTNINAANCPTSTTNLKCASAFLGFHITRSGSGYFENVWVWNADHDLDDPAESKINSFSARGILVESTAAVFLVGTASEHHVIYQYAFNKARNVWAGLIQTETPYFHPTPQPPAPFSINSNYGDPPGTFSDAWGVVITLSSDIFIYGAGLYSFFKTYSQDCVPNRNCQDNMLLIDQQSADVAIFQLTTAGATNMLSYNNVSVAKQADNINGFASTVTFWETSHSVPQGQCGVARRALEPYNAPIILRRFDLLTRQSEDYLYFWNTPARIDTELMVGAMEDDGIRRRPRRNCVFYVNQQNVDPSDPNYARTRAIQFAAIMNAADPGGDYHTLYDVYDNAAAFTDTEDPMRSANVGGNRRNWFRLTSERFALLCEGEVFLIVEEQPATIWPDAIWVTHEEPAILRNGLVTRITEIRPSDIGVALASNNDTRWITPHNYRGHQPPGAIPRRDDEKLELDECAVIDPDKAGKKWDAYPEVGGDIAPYKDFGGCTMHIHQWGSSSGGGGPFDPPPGQESYSVEVTLYDNGPTHKIGFLTRTVAPVNMTSKLDRYFIVTADGEKGPLHFTLGDQKWQSDDGSCSVGGWDHGEDRQMDCGFRCDWMGGDSTDHTPPEIWYA
ncbi:glucan 1,3-beta-glucosidase [Favolaschia claudopus]|uniref:Glucan 1,3-beta-glucosidase n=1 Tax=Favolaschia claudopus TaxID=2862362 RepID=A0AAW0DLT1_9AGAR